MDRFAYVMASAKCGGLGPVDFLQKLRALLEKAISTNTLTAMQLTNIIYLILPLSARTSTLCLKHTSYGPDGYLFCSD